MSRNVKEYAKKIRNKLPDKFNKDSFIRLICAVFPEELEKYKNKKEFFEYVDIYLAQYNPKYLEKYEDYIFHCGDVFHILAVSAPEYLEQLICIMDDQDWDYLKKILAKHNPEYIDKYKGYFNEY